MGRKKVIEGEGDRGRSELGRGKGDGGDGVMLSVNEPADGIHIYCGHKYLDVHGHM